MWSLLNPLAWFKAISGVKYVLGIVVEVAKAISAYLRARAQHREMQKVNQAVKEAQHAATVDEKAQAACKIEKALDPHASCAPGDGAK